MAKRTPSWQQAVEATAALVGEPVVLLDAASARIVHANAAFAACSGQPVDAVVGRSLADLGGWPDAGGVQELLADLRGPGAIRETRLALRRRDGRDVSLPARAGRIGPQGSHLQIVGQAGRDAAQAERVAVFRHVPVGLALTRSQRFVHVNPAFERIFGWRPGELAGQPGRAVWPSDEAYEEIGRRVGPGLRRGEIVEVEPVELAGRDGLARLLRMVAVAMAPQQGIDGDTLWICEDVSERLRMSREMADARRRADQASQAKSQFLANMSHELRTPLNAILGLARLLQQDPSVQSAHARHVGLIAESAAALSAVVSDILDLSKIEAGHVTLHLAPFDLHALARSVHASFGVLAATRELGFALDIAPDVPCVVMGDAQRVRQVLANFVNNALKFTAIGEVRITLSAGEACAVRIEVHDTGPGFDQATRERLFQPFSQADDSTTRRHGGTGLGLAICRELAALMGGHVGAAGRPGHGSTFWLELPLEPSADEPANSDFAPFDERALDGVRVLVVEDNPVNLLICTALLERSGARVAEAVNGLEALHSVEVAAAAGEPHDVVLMDLQMPVLGGIDATRRLRERWPAAALTVIGLSAAAFTSERTRALEAGMDDFVAKPIEPRRLERAILRALGKRRRDAAG